MQNKTNNSFSLYSCIFAGSATLLVAGFLFGMLPIPALASIIVQDSNINTTVTGYHTTSCGFGQLDNSANDCSLYSAPFVMNGTDTISSILLMLSATSYTPQTIQIRLSDTLGISDYYGAFTSATCASLPMSCLTTFTPFVPFAGTYRLRISLTGFVNPSSFSLGANSASSNGASFIIYSDVPSSPSFVPPDGFVDQVTPVDGQNNFTTITFTGHYADSTGQYERIFVTFNDVYPTVSATSFTKLYTIPAETGTNIAYSFTQTFTAGHTYEYQMLLAKADGTSQTSLTTAVAFGTTATNNIAGVVVAGSGTITNLAASGVVTGTGTHFTTTLKVGDIISTAGGDCTILSIVSDTELQCTPITGANSGVSFTHTPQTNLAVTYDTCSTFDIFCYGKNLFVWAFIPSPESLQQFTSIVNFSSPKDSLLAGKFPFAYGFDIANMWNELFDTTASGTLGISIPNLGGGTVDLLSANTISANTWYGSIVRPFISVGLYLMAFWILYKKVFGIHDKDHKTV